jgi:N-carbamoyl-L-amino-acid hydrolase
MEGSVVKRGAVDSSPMSTLDGPAPDLSVDGERLRRRFDAFDEIGATDRGGVDRPALSEANRRARDTLVDRFREAGLEVRVDEMGNIFGRRAGTEEAAPVLVGSHVDSQYNGGRYDGVVGTDVLLQATLSKAREG